MFCVPPRRSHAAGRIVWIVGAGQRRICVQRQILMTSVGLQVVHRDVADVTDDALRSDAADERVRRSQPWIDAIDRRRRKWRRRGRVLDEVRNLVDTVLAHGQDEIRCSEALIEQTGASPQREDRCLRCLRTNRPGEADARRGIAMIRNRRLRLVAKTVVQREAA